MTGKGKRMREVTFSAVNFGPNFENIPEDSAFLRISIM